MKSIWKVTRNIINDKSMYAVYRIKDTSSVDHSGNREYATDFMDEKEEADNIAKSLNSES